MSFFPQNISITNLTGFLGSEKTTIFHPLKWLEKWPGNDRKTHLVFITKNINKNTIDDFFKIIGENELNNC